MRPDQAAWIAVTLLIVALQFLAGQSARQAFVRLIAAVTAAGIVGGVWAAFYLLFKAAA